MKWLGTIPPPLFFADLTTKVSSMKHPRGPHLTKNGENGANSDGVLSAVGDNDGGLAPRERYGSITR